MNFVWTTALLYGRERFLALFLSDPVLLNHFAFIFKNRLGVVTWCFITFAAQLNIHAKQHRDYFDH